MKNSRTLFLLFILIFFSKNITKAQGCLNADVIILIDWSGSENGNEIKLATAAYSFVSELPVSEYQMRVGVITFSDRAINFVNLTGDKEELLNGITYLSLTRAGGGTMINNAMFNALDVLDNKRKSLKIVIIISDGEIYDIRSAEKTLEEFQQKIKIGVFAVQVGESSEGLKSLIEITGNEKNVEKTLPSSLVDALKKLNICN